jgi:hypothetical protein
VSADKFRGEGAVNLSRTVFPQNPTSCFSIANIIPGTVTGNSDTADYKDTLLAEFASRVAVSNCGQVKVTKVTQPAGRTGTFPYTLARTGGQPVRFVDDGGDVSIADTLVADQDFDTHLDLIAGTNYTLTEGAVGPAWAMLGISCGGTDLTLGGTFTVLPSVLTECTITNKLQNGTLIVKKVVVTMTAARPRAATSRSRSTAGRRPRSSPTARTRSRSTRPCPTRSPRPAVGGYATTYSNMRQRPSSGRRIRDLHGHERRSRAHAPSGQVGHQQQRRIRDPPPPGSSPRPAQADSRTPATRRPSTRCTAAVQ